MCAHIHTCTHTPVHTHAHTMTCPSFVPEGYKAAASQGYEKQTQDNLPVLGVPGDLPVPLLGEEVLRGTERKHRGPY